MIFTDFTSLHLIREYKDFLKLCAISTDPLKRTPAESAACKKFMAARNFGRKLKAVMIFQPKFCCVVVVPLKDPLFEGSEEEWITFLLDSSGLVGLLHPELKDPSSISWTMIPYDFRALSYGGTA